MSKYLPITVTSRPREIAGGGGSGSVNIAGLQAAVAALQSMWSIDENGNLFTEYNVYSQGNMAAFGSSVVTPTGVTLAMNIDGEIEIIPRNDYDVAGATAPLRVNELRIGNVRLYYDDASGALVCDKEIITPES